MPRWEDGDPIEWFGLLLRMVMEIGGIGGWGKIVGDAGGTEKKDEGCDGFI